jgi:hypothetical protein
MSASTWDRIDEPVLRWVATLPPSLATGKIWDFRAVNDGDAPVDGVMPSDVDAALHRLERAAFVAGNSDPGMHLWWSLRLAPNGLVYLGEWPDVELATSSAALRSVLRALADNAPSDDQRDALARAAGFVGRTMDGVLRDTVNSIARDAGEGLKLP